MWIRWAHRRNQGMKMWIWWCKKLGGTAADTNRTVTQNHGPWTWMSINSMAWAELLGMRWYVINVRVDNGSDNKKIRRGNGDMDKVSLNVHMGILRALHSPGVPRVPFSGGRYRKSLSFFKFGRWCFEFELSPWPHTYRKLKERTAHANANILALNDYSTLLDPKGKYMSCLWCLGCWIVLYLIYRKG